MCIADTDPLGVQKLLIGEHHEAFLAISSDEHSSLYSIDGLERVRTYYGLE
jgi:hypothetical protein